MNEIETTESGFITTSEHDFGTVERMTDVEILKYTRINVIARARRAGRYWLLKGLIPELQESPAALRRLQKEFELHSRLLNRGIVRAVNLEFIEGLGPCIVEEWVEGTTLSQLMKEGKLSKKERRRIMRELIASAGYMHSLGVVHRDLKPSNVMVRKDGGGVVVIDFGIADAADYAELKQAAGSRGYISPEQEKEGGCKNHRRYLQPRHYHEGPLPGI